MTTAERMVPSVEDARGRHQWACWLALVFPRDPDGPRIIEAASVRLDMAVAAAHKPWGGPAWAVTVDDVAYA